MSELTIYTDGACSGNPGPGGWGAVILQDGTAAQKIYGGAPNTTNNRMEMTAVVEALKAQPDGQVLTLLTDSSYVKDGITKWINGWKRNGWRTSQKQPVKNQDLWQEIDQQRNRVKVDWQWVKGHAGNEWNELADELARRGVSENR